MLPLDAAPSRLSRATPSVTTEKKCRQSPNTHSGTHPKPRVVVYNPSKRARPLPPWRAKADAAYLDRSSQPTQTPSLPPCSLHLIHRTPCFPKEREATDAHRWEYRWGQSNTEGGAKQADRQAGRQTSLTGCLQHTSCWWYDKKEGACLPPSCLGVANPIPSSPQHSAFCRKHENWYLARTTATMLYFSL